MPGPASKPRGGSPGVAAVATGVGLRLGVRVGLGLLIPVVLAAAGTALVHLGGHSNASRLPPPAGLQPAAVSEPVGATGVSTDPAGSGQASQAESGQAVAAQVDQLLSSSESARAGVQPALTAIASCQATSSDLLALQTAASTRRGLVGQLAGLDLTSLDAAELSSLLQALWLNSAAADDAYLRWGQAQAGCTGSAETDANKLAGDAASRLATAEKTRFLAAWNPLASTYGLPARDQGRI